MSQNPRTESVGPGGERPPGRIELLAGGTELANRFEVREVLGTGGYAVVYRAFDRFLKREVALKVLRRDRLSPGALLRLRREAAIARDVVHPRIVRVFDIEEAGETVFLTMEIVEGGSLGDRLTRHSSANPVAIDDAVKWASQALEGLATLHTMGILHRDIKPGNLLLTADDEVKLSDFGLALHLERDETRATTHESVLGTLEYLSPEQALGQPVDARSDLYSLGVVLFEMVAGRLPFVTQSSLGSLLERLRQDATPDLADLRADTPAWLAAVVRRLLERDPLQRYSSAAAVLADLESRRVRSRFRPRRGLWLAATLAALGLAATSFWVRQYNAARFSHMVVDGNTGVRAVDRSGRTLWQRDDIRPQGNFVPFRAAGGDLRLAAFLGGAFEPLNRSTSILHFLDPQSGAKIEEVLVPSSALQFVEFSDTYGFTINRCDLDRDGIDELVLSFTHDPYYPGYVVLYEPRLRRSRTLLVSAGHHRFAGATDLDGDGRDEVLLLGINNRMGWSAGIAAVRIDPPLDDPTLDRRSGSAVYAPDLADIGGSLQPLYWYSLLPSNQRFVDQFAISIDPIRRQLSLQKQDGSGPLVLDFDGFLVDLPSGLAPARRRQLRDAAWKGMREGARLLAAGDAGLAVVELEQAAGAARAAGVPALEEWLERLRAQALLEGGETAKALARYDALWSSSHNAPEIAFDAARYLHSQGQLDLAAAWYRRGLGAGASLTLGRSRIFTLRGLILVLGERGQWQQALTELDRFAQAYPNQEAAPERAFVEWRAGRPPRPDVVFAASGFQDLHRYWWYELRLASGEDPAMLLAELRAGRSAVSEYGPLFDGLAGHLLAQNGSSREALPRLRAAAEDARRLQRTDPTYRVHLAILEDRLAALTP
ncbi:MAG: serine/threonine protein kinase [Thermoanaerobaculia bacterium]|jgi:tRNA A-37 threonylcarbamoyl transferase component Bud32/tetratricopeptide (TPR) repeat protein|nr:serine/threonine protein kinase [Thermoanaerobaculia bacterium]MBP9823866.1 serine/threonine protein kinase [Thermoanaerobaculia bacterium]